MKILVTGSKGQLGSEIGVIAPDYPRYDFTFIDLEDVDLGNAESIRGYFAQHNFDLIINCAAYTAVDLAEDNAEVAFRVNGQCVGVMAEIAREKNMRFIHISTDYVFNGESSKPIDEDERPAPLSVYGHSKLEGEQLLLKTLPNAYIIRTAWVYSTFGKNFVKTISNIARQRSELTVVADQIGSPTYATDLARAILTIANSILSEKADKPGIYHYSNEGAISWYDFAYFIVQHYKLNCTVKPIRTEDYKTKATRPKFSLLNKKKIKDTYGLTIPHWHESLVRCLEKMDK